MNPVFNRVVSRCNVCQSTHHWAKDCPHANKNVNMTENVEKHSEETVHMTLMTEAKLLDKISNQDVLVMEACNTAIVDTACTKTVCGKEWLQYMLDSLSSEELKSVEIKKSHMPFKFGDGRIINSYQTVTFPAKVGNRLCNIKTEVVECKIPLLLSKESLAKAEAVIDIGKDHVMMFGQKVNIQTTSTGHYCVNIMRNDKERTDDENVVLVIDNNMEISDKRNTLLKLHKQFGHASQEKLLNLLKTAGKNRSGHYRSSQGYLQEMSYLPQIYTS